MRPALPREEIQLFCESNPKTGMIYPKEKWEEIIKDGTRPIRPKQGDSDSDSQRFRVTVTDMWGGRGHDFMMKDPDANRKGGGLVVIATSIPYEGTREWIQWVGRTARQDKPGQYYAVLRADDDLLAPKLERHSQPKVGTVERANPTMSITHLNLYSDFKVRIKDGKVSLDDERELELEKANCECLEKRDHCRLDLDEKEKKAKEVDEEVREAEERRDRAVNDDGSNDAAVLLAGKVEEVRRKRSNALDAHKEARASFEQANKELEDNQQMRKKEEEQRANLVVKELLSLRDASNNQNLVAKENEQLAGAYRNELCEKYAS